MILGIMKHLLITMMKMILVLIMIMKNSLILQKKITMIIIIIKIRIRIMLLRTPIVIFLEKLEKVLIFYFMKKIQKKIVKNLIK